jgi:hypothetical protein
VPSTSTGTAGIDQGPVKKCLPVIHQISAACRSPGNVGSVRDSSGAGKVRSAELELIRVISPWGTFGLVGGGMTRGACLARPRTCKGFFEVLATPECAPSCKLIECCENGAPLLCETAVRRDSAKDWPA